MKKAILTVVIISLMLISTLGGVTHFVVAQISSQVNGLIDSDTTWTLANSPYTLTAPVVIEKNVTLTIEAGATVNLSNYSITVDGTLIARGSTAKPITFNSPNVDSQIVFTNFSGTGCIIENAFISSTIFMNANTMTPKGLNLYNVSPLINNNSICRIHINGGAPIISNNTITDAISINVGQPKFLHNNITKTNFGSFYIFGGATEISYNTIACGIEERGYFYPAGLGTTISNNIIYGCGIDIDHYAGSVSILNNNISASDYGTAIKVIGLPSVIANNTVTGNNDIGIYVPNMESLISNNTVYRCTKGIVSGLNTTIERNAIFDNTESGIEIQAGTCIIRNNTIARNIIGISLNTSSSTIIYNNIENNSQNSICLSNTSQDIEAINNWWGTTDLQSINQTIYDSKYDQTLGRVNFIPLLTLPNSQVFPEPRVTTPTPSSSPSPSSSSTPTSTVSPSPSIPEFPSWIVLPALLVFATLVAAVAIKRKIVVRL